LYPKSIFIFDEKFTVLTVVLLENSGTFWDVKSVSLGKPLQTFRKCCGGSIFGVKHEEENAVP